MYKKKTYFSFEKFIRMTYKIHNKKLIMKFDNPLMYYLVNYYQEEDFYEGP